MADLIDCKEAIKILGHTAPGWISQRCKDGTVKSARKIGRAWVMERSDVEKLRDEAQTYLHDRANSPKGRAAIKISVSAMHNATGRKRGATLQSASEIETETEAGADTE